LRFLLDQDVYAMTAHFLSGLGHDTISVSQIGCSRSSDVELLHISRERDRIFVTRDRDFGGLVFVQGLGAGVIYLRILPSTQHTVHEELERVLTRYDESELKRAFVVIEPGRHRFRRLPH
jgi:predicted nuclease of predicted toxin-antitoxin system